jgi:hypothetical protein
MTVPSGDSVVNPSYKSRITSKEKMSVASPGSKDAGSPPIPRLRIRASEFSVVSADGAVFELQPWHAISVKRAIANPTTRIQLRSLVSTTERGPNTAARAKRSEGTGQRCANPEKCVLKRWFWAEVWSDVKGVRRVPAPLCDLPTPTRKR